LRFQIANMSGVRSLIARAILERLPESSRIEEIELKPHQIEAVQRAQGALAEFGGVLLADPVGTGKTYVALAIANGAEAVVTVGPAVLRKMWQSTASRCGISLRYISFESLSRGAACAKNADIVIIDEAHHARNSATRRFANLAHLVSGQRVILISATPIHNRRDDLVSLLSLFMGSRAESLSDAELARVVVRRAHLAHSIEGMPALVNPEWIRIGTDERTPALLMNLPPPLPVSDGGIGGALVIHSLVRQWISTDAALIGALRRRLVRAEAMIAALESDTWPSSTELSSWISGEDTVQLGLPGMLAGPTPLSCALLPVVQRHRDALIEVLSAARTSRSDIDRSAAIIEIISRHPERKAVVFSQYADSIDGLFAHLAQHGHVAALTGSGAKVSGGRLSRDDVLRRFAPLAANAAHPRAAEEIKLLLTTDLLSEGVNLQDAGIVIHLDFPWTPARMEQRAGRLTRIGSPHSEIHSYSFRPPASAESIVRIEAILTRKMRDAGVVTETLPSLSMFAIGDTGSTNPAHVTEEIRRILKAWVTESQPLTFTSVAVSAVRASRAGFLAMIEHDDSRRLIVEIDGRISDEPQLVLDRVRECSSDECISPKDEVQRTIERISSWLSANQALGDPGSQRKLIQRIDRMVHRSARHSRPLVAWRAAVAHSVLASRLDAHAESELRSLDHVADDELIDRVIKIGGPHSRSRPASHACLKALILFRK
jgi:hypothetical protein